MPTYYASPTGSGDGLSATSPGSLTSVKTLARAASGNVTIYLRGGVYQLAAPLAFTSGDSGKGGTVVWRAYDGELPVLSGGIPITGWTLHDGAKHIHRASVPAGTNARQLYVNGLRADRANSGGAMGFATAGNVGATYVSTLASVPAFARPQDLELVLRHLPPFSDWVENRLGVTSASRVGDTTTLTMDSAYQTLANPATGWPANPYRLENAYEFLTASTLGCWYLDADASLLYYVPRDGEDMATADVRLPVIEQIIAGDPASPVADIEFQGIAFEHAGWLKPTTDKCFIEVQSNVFKDRQNAWAMTAIPAAVSLPRSQRVTFRRNVFRRLGGAGLHLGGGARDGAVHSNIFTDISGVALRIGDTPAYLNATYPDGGFSVRSNYIHDSSVEYRGGVGLLVGIVDHTQIIHNRIERMPYTGISLGWDWDGVPSSAGANEIGWNRVHDVMLELEDGGAIYMLGQQGTGGRSSVHDNYLKVAPLRGIDPTLYFDQGSRYWDASANVVVNVGGFHWAGFNTDAWWNTVLPGSFASNTSITYGGDGDGYGAFTQQYNTVTAPTIITGTDPSAWPAGAQAIAAAAGLDADDAWLLTWAGEAIAVVVPASIPAASAPLSAQPLGAAGSAQAGASVASPMAASADAVGGAVAGISPASAPMAGSVAHDTIVPVTSFLTRLPFSGLSFLAGPRSIEGIAREIGPELSPAHAGVGAVALGVQTSAWTGLDAAMLNPQARPLGMAPGAAVGLPSASAPLTAAEIRTPTVGIPAATLDPQAGAIEARGGAGVGVGIRVPLQAENLAVGDLPVDLPWDGIVLLARAVPTSLLAAPIPTALVARSVPISVRCGMAATCRQGDDLDVEVRVVDARGRAVDITGAVLTGAAQTGSGAEIPADAYTIDDGPKGYGRVRWVRGTTSAFTANATYSYDVRARLANGDVHTVGEGAFVVRDPRAATP